MTRPMKKAAASGRVHFSQPARGGSDSRKQAADQIRRQTEDLNSTDRSRSRTYLWALADRACYGLPR